MRARRLQSLGISIAASLGLACAPRASNFSLDLSTVPPGLCPHLDPSEIKPTADFPGTQVRGADGSLRWFRRDTPWSDFATYIERTQTVLTYDADRGLVAWSIDADDDGRVLFAPWRNAAGIVPRKVLERPAVFVENEGRWGVIVPPEHRTIEILDVEAGTRFPIHVATKELRFMPAFLRKRRSVLLIEGVDEDDCATYEWGCPRVTSVRLSTRTRETTIELDGQLGSLMIAPDERTIAVLHIQYDEALEDIGLQNVSFTSSVVTRIYDGRGTLVADRAFRGAVNLHWASPTEIIVVGPSLLRWNIATGELHELLAELPCVKPHGGFRGVGHSSRHGRMLVFDSGADAAGTDHDNYVTAWGMMSLATGDVERWNYVSCSGGASAVTSRSEEFIALAFSWSPSWPAHNSRIRPYFEACEDTSWRRRE